MSSRTATLRRYLGSGLVEVGLALMLVVIDAIGFRPGDGAVAVILLSILTCAGAAFTAWYPRIGAVITCVGFTGLAWLPNGLVGTSLYAPMIVILSCAWHEKFWTASATTLWGYLISLWLSFRNATAAAEQIQAIIVWIGFYSLPWLIGLALRNTQLYERRRLATRAEAQRREIAAELHDNVTHDLSAIVTQATAAQNALNRGDADVDPAKVLADIASRGSRTATYLHNLMTLMRVAETSSAPASFSRELQDGAERLATAGFELEIYTDHDVDALPSAISDALGKITREALNNMEQYGDPAEPAETTVSAGEHRIAVAFRNATSQEEHAGPRQDGLGIVGMRERAEAIGGTLETRLSDGYWSVTVSIPITRVGDQIS